jgi:hypothetical protein
MNAQPQFLLNEPKKNRRNRKRNAQFWPTLWTALILLLLVPTGYAVTQFDLKTQVRGILGLANGGTNASSLSAGVCRSNATTVSCAELSQDATTSTSNAVTVVAVNGTSVPTNAAADTVLLTTSSATGAWKAVNNCANALTYATASHTFGCSGALLSGSFADAEVPSGSITGTTGSDGNATFTLAHTPSPAGSLQLYVNGQYQKATLDYTLATATISFQTGAIPLSGAIIIANYRY